MQRAEPRNLQTALSLPAPTPPCMHPQPTVILHEIGNGRHLEFTRCLSTRLRVGTTSTVVPDVTGETARLMCRLTAIRDGTRATC